MIKIKFAKDLTDLFDNIGTVVNTSEDGIYRHIPFWFKETDEEDVYRLLTFEQLPNELIALLNQSKDEYIKELEEIISHFKEDGIYALKGLEDKVNNLKNKQR